MTLVTAHARSDETVGTRIVDAAAPPASTYVESLDAAQEAERSRLARGCQMLNPVFRRYHCNPDPASLRDKLIGLLGKRDTGYDAGELAGLTNDELAELAVAVVARATQPVVDEPDLAVAR